MVLSNQLSRGYVCPISYQGVSIREAEDFLFVSPSKKIPVSRSVRPLVSLSDSATNEKKTPRKLKENEGKQTNGRGKQPKNKGNQPKNEGKTTEKQRKTTVKQGETTNKVTEKKKRKTTENKKRKQTELRMNINRKTTEIKQSTPYHTQAKQGNLVENKKLSE